jgi:hypothetical protein
MPRSKTDSRTFERQCGHVSVLLEAGKLFNGREWVEQPLPYGTTPRLVMVHLSSEAVRTQSRRVEIGDSTKQFLNALGIPSTGGVRGGYTMFRRQMEALAACRLTLGMMTEGKAVTVDAKPIKRFEAWLQNGSSQHAMWPGVLELSQDFFETLANHAVPLDYRAISALRHSTLGLDIYTWLAHRLYRINKPAGVRLSWANLYSQFGQEYRGSKDFKREFRTMLRQVCTVYPEARIDSFPGGLVFKPSPPPITKTQFSMAGSLPTERVIHRSVDEKSYPR